MSFRKKRVLLMAPFYMLFEFFLVKYTLMLLVTVNNFDVLIITLLIGVFNVFPMFIEEIKSNSVTRFMCEISYIWMGASVFYFIDILIIYTAGIFPKNIIILLLTLPVLIISYSYYKAHAYVVNEKILKVPNLKKDVNIAHVSDIHFGSVRHRKIISDLKNKLNDLKDCDFAIISGDFADGSCKVTPDDFMDLSEVKMPVMFTPGNHDYYNSIDDVKNACDKAGIIVLDNNNLEIANLNIFGLSYSFDNLNKLSLDEIKKFKNPDLVNILIYHVPYYWEEFSKIFDIQLSGHTHGGQFYPVVWIANKMFKYNKGLFKNSNGKYLNVSTGFGTMDEPLRWGSDAEIVLLKLRKL